MSVSNEALSFCLFVLPAALLPPVYLQRMATKDAEECVSIRFNPLRAGFKRAEDDPNAVDTFCPDVLNTGVK